MKASDKKTELPNEGSIGLQTCADWRVRVPRSA